ncbi:MAG: c-type cytochrome, partial [Longimicrobiales bacterium]
PMNWATGVDPETGRPIEVPEARFTDRPIHVTPGALGAHNWHPMSFNPRTGLVYIPAQRNSYAYGHEEDFQYQEGVWNTGIGPTEDAVGEPVPPSGFLLAWDPVAQEERWRVEYDDMWNGGTLSTGGDLVFQGTSDWRFVAYRATDGEQLWEVAVPTGVIGGPISYELDGTQYIAVMAGWGGVYGLRTGGRGSTGRLLVFALGGTESLAADPAAAPEEREPPTTAIPVNASEEAVARGAEIYAQQCAQCHGPAAMSGGVIPDLRYADPEVYESFEDIVLAGTRSEQGMPSFSQWLDAEDVEAVRAYVLSRRAALTED